MCGQTTRPSGAITDNAAKLCRVAHRAGLNTMRAGGREDALRDAPGAEQLGHSRDLRARGPVAGAVFVRQHRQLDPLAASESCGLPRGCLADQDQSRAGLLEVTAGAVQLDRVILTVDSPVVAEPDERGRAVAPQVAQAHVVALLVRQDDVCQHVCP